jgi:hypothetical protein
VDTLIVPVQKEGFEKIFIGMGCWYPVRLSSQSIQNLKYIAAYQTSPVSAITHYAIIKGIERYGETKMYKIVFSRTAEPIGPIPYGDAPNGTMQVPRYTSFDILRSGTTVSEALGLR